MAMNAKQQATLIGRLSEALEVSPGLSDTEIWAYDHNTDRPDFPRYVLNHTRAGDVGAIAWHCYSSGRDKYRPLREFAQDYPGVRQVMTECWTHVDSGEKFFDLPEFVSQPVKHGAAGSLAWTVAGSVNYDVSYPGGCQPCSGLVQVDMVHGNVSKTHDYYTMGHFSHYVKNGDHYVPTVVGDHIYPDGTGVDTTAFVTSDGAKVAVIQNKIRTALNLQLTFQGRNESYLGTVPGRSVVTWRFD